MPALQLFVMRDICPGSESIPHQANWQQDESAHFSLVIP